MSQYLFCITSYLYDVLDIKTLGDACFILFAISSAVSPRYYSQTRKTAVEGFAPTLRCSLFNHSDTPCCTEISVTAFVVKTSVKGLSYISTDKGMRPAQSQATIQTTIPGAGGYVGASTQLPQPTKYQFNHSHFNIDARFCCRLKAGLIVAYHDVANTRP
jgi:hypothetical protein